jgi:hypothetical protein
VNSPSPLHSQSLGPPLLLSGRSGKSGPSTGLSDAWFLTLGAGTALALASTRAEQEAGEFGERHRRGRILYSTASYAGNEVIEVSERRRRRGWARIDARPSLQDRFEVRELHNGDITCGVFDGHGAGSLLQSVKSEGIDLFGPGWQEAGKWPSMQQQSCH